MENMGFTAIPAITVICYLVTQIVKATAVDNKWLPIVSGTVGAILGIAAMCRTLPQQIIFPLWQSGLYPGWLQLAFIR